jgi:flavin reductase (DIM6/NTAB) family NADH-FMN oxidoreductase RutF
VSTSGTEAFEDLVAALDYPMFVVTAHAKDELSGCLVGFASQTSIKPPRFLVGLSKRNRTFRIAADATHLAVHVFDREHRDIPTLFGERTGDSFDKFAHCAWRFGPQQAPVLDDATAWFVGKILDRHALGDHVGYLLEPIAGESPPAGRTLVSYADMRDLPPGKPA